MAERSFNSYHTSSAHSAQCPAPRVQVKSQEENKILIFFSASSVADALPFLGPSLLPRKDYYDFEHIFILWQKYSTAVGEMFSSCKVWLLQLTLWLVHHLQTLPNITTHWQLSGSTLCMTCYCPNIIPIRRAGDVTTLLIVSNQE